MYVLSKVFTLKIANQGLAAMVLPKDNSASTQISEEPVTSSKKRRLRRKRLQAAQADHSKTTKTPILEILNKQLSTPLTSDVPKKINELPQIRINKADEDTTVNLIIDKTIVNKMPNEDKSRADVLAAREAKKIAKLKGKNIGNVGQSENKKGTSFKDVQKDVKTPESTSSQNVVKVKETLPQVLPTKPIKESPKSKDEVDKAVIATERKEQIKTERAPKKTAKQCTKDAVAGDRLVDKDKDMTIKDVVETLKDIVNVVKEVQDVTAKVQAISLEPKKHDLEEKSKPKQQEEGKSKAELKAERRAKQEAQRAAKQAALENATKPKPDPPAKAVKPSESKARETTPTKIKTTEKSKPKSQYIHRLNWFQHLSIDQDKEALKKIPLNSNLHPAIIKLGVQLASRVVSGSNARCIALLDALRKMVGDYTLPAKTEFARGLESHLACSLEFLWSMRQPSASQTNAVKYFRHHLTQLPNNVDDYDAKKKLQDVIDNYIRDQIDTAGEAISIAVREKICTGDNILTYGCSSLIERILREAWQAPLHFHTVVVGNRVHSDGRELLRRLTAHGLPCTYVDITALSFVMKKINKVLLSADALLVNGSVLGAAGTAQTALLARAHNVPVLVACETHKVSERVQTDGFVYNEIGDPDALIDKSDDNSPLKDWRSNPNLTPLNLMYDVTPPSLVTAVVTELAILPCTSAPVVLRTKLAEHGV